MKKRERGIIPSIPDTPENVALAIMRGKPKENWNYLKREKDRKGSKKQTEETDKGFG